MKARPLFRQVFAAFAAAVYLFTNAVFSHAAESNFWAERRREVRKSREASPLLMAGVPPSSASLLQGMPSIAPQSLAPSLSREVAEDLPRGFARRHADLLSALSASHGSVRKISLPRTPDPRAPVVIHIQDVHQNAEAQKNIAGAVGSLMSRKTVGLVALEGAFDPMDLGRFRSFPDRDVVGKTADWLLREHRISGPVHAALTVPGDVPPLAGIDDPVHHQANVAAYTASAPKVQEFKELLAGRQSALDARKAAVFPPDLLVFDAEVASYRSGKGALGSYVKVLAARSPSPLPKDVEDFLKALAMESSLDFKQVEAERKRLIERLMETLTREQTDALLQRSMEYRLGRVRYADFYGDLRALCEKSGVPLSGFPAMDAYVRYVLLSDRISAEKLLADIAALERSCYGRLARTPEEKALVAESLRLHLSGKLIDFSLTPDEWADYRSGEKDRTWDLSSFESFYEEARARDGAMAENLLKAARSLDSAPQAVVLVTGGYHSPGLTDRLTRAGCAVVSFTPRIEKVDAIEGSSYLSVFTQEKTPLDRLFQGQKLFLATDPFSPATRGRAALGISAAKQWKEGGLGDRVAAYLNLKEVAPGFADAVDLEETELVGNRVEFRLKFMKEGSEVRTLLIQVELDAEGNILRFGEESVAGLRERVRAKFPKVFKEVERLAREHGPQVWAFVPDVEWPLFDRLVFPDSSGKLAMEWLEALAAHDSFHPVEVVLRIAGMAGMAQAERRARETRGFTEETVRRAGMIVHRRWNDLFPEARLNVDELPPDMVRERRAVEAFERRQETLPREYGRAGVQAESAVKERLQAARTELAAGRWDKGRETVLSAIALSDSYPFALPPQVRQEVKDVFLWTFGLENGAYILSGASFSRLREAGFSRSDLEVLMDVNGWASSTSGLSTVDQWVDRMLFWRSLYIGDHPDALQREPWLRGMVSDKLMKLIQDIENSRSAEGVPDAALIPRVYATVDDIFAKPLRQPLDDGNHRTGTAVLNYLLIRYWGLLDEERYALNYENGFPRNAVTLYGPDGFPRMEVALQDRPVYRRRPGEGSPRGTPAKEEEPDAGRVPGGEPSPDTMGLVAGPSPSEAAPVALEGWDSNPLSEKTAVLKALADEVWPGEESVTSRETINGVEIATIRGRSHYIVIGGFLFVDSAEWEKTLRFHPGVRKHAAAVIPCDLGLTPWEKDAFIDFDSSGVFTAQAVAMLQAHQDKIRGGRWLDAGSGSGVLSFVLARLGASEVRGIDDRWAAVERSRRIAALMGLTQVSFDDKDFAGVVAQSPVDPFDGIVANLGQNGHDEMVREADFYDRNSLSGLRRNWHFRFATWQDSLPAWYMLFGGERGRDPSDLGPLPVAAFLGGEGWNISSIHQSPPRSTGIVSGHIPLPTAVVLQRTDGGRQEPDNLESEYLSSRKHSSAMKSFIRYYLLVHGYVARQGDWLSRVANQYTAGSGRKKSKPYGHFRQAFPRDHLKALAEQRVLQPAGPGEPPGTSATLPETYAGGLDAFWMAYSASGSDLSPESFAREELLRAGVFMGTVNRLKFHENDIGTDPANNLLRAWVSIIHAPRAESRAFLEDTVDDLVKAHHPSPEVERALRTSVEEVKKAIGAGRWSGRLLGLALDVVLSLGILAAGLFVAPLEHLVSASAPVFLVSLPLFVLLPVFLGRRGAAREQEREHRERNIAAWEAGKPGEALTKAEGKSFRDGMIRFSVAGTIVVLAMNWYSADKIWADKSAASSGVVRVFPSGTSEGPYLEVRKESDEIVLAFVEPAGDSVPARRIGEYRQPIKPGPVSREYIPTLDRLEAGRRLLDLAHGIPPSGEERARRVYEMLHEMAGDRPTLSEPAALTMRLSSNAFLGFSEFVRDRLNPVRVISDRQRGARFIAVVDEQDPENRMVFEVRGEELLSLGAREERKSDPGVAKKVYPLAHFEAGQNFYKNLSRRPLDLTPVAHGKQNIAGLLRGVFINLSSSEGGGELFWLTGFKSGRTSYREESFAYLVDSGSFPPPESVPSLQEVSRSGGDFIAHPADGWAAPDWMAERQDGSFQYFRRWGVTADPSGKSWVVYRRMDAEDRLTAVRMADSDPVRFTIDGLSIDGRPLVFEGGKGNLHLGAFLHVLDGLSDRVSISPALRSLAATEEQMLGHRKASFPSRLELLADGRWLATGFRVSAWISRWGDEMMSRLLRQKVEDAREGLLMSLREAAPPSTVGWEGKPTPWEDIPAENVQILPHPATYLWLNARFGAFTETKWIDKDAKKHPVWGKVGAAMAAFHGRAEGSRPKVKELFRRANNNNNETNKNLILVIVNGRRLGTQMARYPGDKGPIIAIDEDFYRLTIGGDKPTPGGQRVFMERFIHELAHNNRIGTDEEKIQDEAKVLREWDWYLWEVLGARDPALEEFLESLSPGERSLVTGKDKYKVFKQLKIDLRGVSDKGEADRIFRERMMAHARRVGSTAAVAVSPATNLDTDPLAKQVAHLERADALARRIDAHMAGMLSWPMSREEGLNRRAWAGMVSAFGDTNGHSLVWARVILDRSKNESDPAERLDSLREVRGLLERALPAYAHFSDPGAFRRFNPAEHVAEKPVSGNEGYTHRIFSYVRKQDNDRRALVENGWDEEFSRRLAGIRDAIHEDLRTVEGWISQHEMEESTEEKDRTAEKNSPPSSATLPETYEGGLEAFWSAYAASRSDLTPEKFARKELLRAGVFLGTVDRLRFHEKDIDEDPANNLLRAWVSIIHAPRAESKAFLEDTVDGLVKAHKPSPDVEQALRTSVEKVKASIGAGRRSGRFLGLALDALLAAGVIAAGLLAEPLRDLSSAFAPAFLLLLPAMVFLPLFLGKRGAVSAQEREHRERNIEAWEAGEPGRALTKRKRRETRRQTRAPKAEAKAPAAPPTRRRAFLIALGVGAAGAAAAALFRGSEEKKELPPAPKEPPAKAPPSAESLPPYPDLSEAELVPVRARFRTFLLSLSEKWERSAEEAPWAPLLRTLADEFRFIDHPDGITRMFVNMTVQDGVFLQDSRTGYPRFSLNVDGVLLQGLLALMDDPQVSGAHRRKAEIFLESYVAKELGTVEFVKQNADHPLATVYSNGLLLAATGLKPINGVWLLPPDAEVVRLIKDERIASLVKILAAQYTMMEISGYLVRARYLARHGVTPSDFTALSVQKGISLHLKDQLENFVAQYGQFYPPGDDLPMKLVSQHMTTVLLGEDKPAAANTKPALPQKIIYRMALTREVYEKGLSSFKFTGKDLLPAGWFKYILDKEYYGVKPQELLRRHAPAASPGPGPNSLVFYILGMLFPRTHPFVRAALGLAGAVAEWKALGFLMGENVLRSMVDKDPFGVVFAAVALLTVAATVHIVLRRVEAERSGLTPPSRWEVLVHLFFLSPYALVPFFPALLTPALFAHLAYDGVLIGRWLLKWNPRRAAVAASATLLGAALAVGAGASRDTAAPAPSALAPDEQGRADGEAAARLASGALSADEVRSLLLPRLEAADLEALAPGPAFFRRTAARSREEAGYREAFVKAFQRTRPRDGLSRPRTADLFGTFYQASVPGSPDAVVGTASIQVIETFVTSETLSASQALVDRVRKSNAVLESGEEPIRVRLVAGEESVRDALRSMAGPHVAYREPPALTSSGLSRDFEAWTVEEGLTGRSLRVAVSLSKGITDDGGGDSIYLEALRAALRQFLRDRPVGPTDLLNMLETASIAELSA